MLEIVLVLRSSGLKSQASPFLSKCGHPIKISRLWSTLDSMFTHPSILQIVIKHLLKMSVWEKPEGIPDVMDLTA